MTKVLFILSRDYSSEPNSGRKKIIYNYLNFYKKKYDVSCVNLISMFDAKGFRKLEYLMYFLKSLIFNFKLPLQSHIFINKRNKSKIYDEYESFKPHIVFIDGVRFIPLINFSDISCTKVLDMDDLLSRRYEFYINKSAGVSFGIYGRKLQFILNIIPNFIKTYILINEVKKISIIEKKVINIFDKIVFSSSTEMNLFKTMYNISKSPLLFSQIFPIKSYEVAKKNMSDSKLNFIFIGSDMVLQNQYTIKFLTDIWHNFKIENILYIVGKMNNTYIENKNIKFLGYVEDISLIYNKMDALLAPAFIKGGIKTKVLEAFQYNLPTIGNNITFEGFDLLSNYPFLLKNTDFSKWLSITRSEFNSHRKLSDKSILKILKTHNNIEHTKFLKKLLK